MMQHSICNSRNRCNASEGKLVILLVAGFLLMSVVRVGLAYNLNVSIDVYTKVHDSKVHPGTILDTIVVRSAAHCGAMCSRNDRCQMINFCPKDGSLGKSVCSLLGDITSQAAESEMLRGCFQLEKVRTEEISGFTASESAGTSEPLRCENNGTLENGICKCAIQYGGTACQRLIRDCTEAYANGHRASYPGITLRIQPVGTSAPFWISCIVDWGGITFALIRTNTATSFNVDWTTAKTWIGDSSSAISHSADYFIGLDNLHHLLGQAEYEVQVYGTYNESRLQGWVYYSNFSVGPENSSYALSYQTSFVPFAPLDNGFSGSAPLVFSTNDRDTNGCARGYPGWFGDDCSGFSLFADTLTWPVNGQAINIDYLSVGLIRRSDFIEN